MGVWRVILFFGGLWSGLGLWGAVECCGAVGVDTVRYSIAIEEVTIRSSYGEELSIDSGSGGDSGGTLRFEEIGARVFSIDSLALRENISVSLAEMVSHSSTVFVKSYGRATLSTASIRGAAPSHTKVVWNGMNITSPMVGMVDFSLIPSYFVDNVNIYRGAASVKMLGGGFGGGITLATELDTTMGFSGEYVQGVGSFSTFDSFLRLSYGGSGRVRGQTRLYRVSSENNFSYTNYRRKVYIKDENGRVTDSYYPTERNRNGSFNDFHLLQELYYSSPKGALWSGVVWLMDSRRGIPMLSVDYRNESRSSNSQTDRTVRTVVKWEKSVDRVEWSAQVGYNGTNYHYSYLQDVGVERLAEMIDSHSITGSAFVSGGAVWQSRSNRWELSGSAALYNHWVRSEDRAVIGADGVKRSVGYDKSRLESSVVLSSKYRMGERMGIALDLRQESYGDRVVPPIPALFIDYLVSERGNVILKASYSRNYRFPTLNDLYFVPGGNDSLRIERGHSFDIGGSFALSGKWYEAKGEVSLFRSMVSDWILWLPSQRGFWSPVNVQRVKSYGAEFIGGGSAHLSPQSRVSVSANFAITRSINCSEPLNVFDNSVGKQLVYIPVYSAAINGSFSYKRWSAVYKWNWYSERFTASDNSYIANLNVLDDYFMNDFAIERAIKVKRVGLAIKLQINNLFNRAYESVLSRPMAGRNYAIFIEGHF